MANFTPEQRDYKVIGNFKFWCQKTLPAIYDDSLSYYELLCKVVAYINDLIENGEIMEENIANQLIAYNELQDFTNHYFDNLDVQNEINNKLDSMARDGSLTELIKAYVDPYINSQNNRITVLENRMDTFASLPDGSTAGDAELTDIRIPALGFNDNQPYPSAGEAVRGQISVLSESINEISESTFEIVNLIKTSSLMDRKYYNPSNGQLLTGDGVKSTDLIPIDPSKQYYYYTNFASAGETLFSACYFKDDKSYNGQQSIVSVRTDPVILIPADSAFIGITIYNSCVDKCALIDAIYADEYFISAQNPSNIIPPTKRIKIKPKNDITVSNAAGFISALALAATKAKSNDWFTIYLEDGEYDLLPYVDLQTDYATGITIPPYTNVVGKNYLGAKIILDNPSTSKPLTASWLSTLNFGGSGSIENLYVYGNNVRYAVHDDFASADFVRIVKNCKLEHGVNTLATTDDRQCAYGMGLRSGCNALFVNTELIGNSAGLLLHDTTTSCDKESNVTFVGCRFVDGSWYEEHSRQVRSAYLTGMVGGTSGWKKGNIVFANCSFNDPILHQETIPGVQSLDVSGWGNNQSKSITNEITVNNLFA